MRNIPNAISVGRLVCSASLFFLLSHELLFLILYIGCGLSDVLDGYIARKTNTQSELGARLDSLADTVLFVLITFCMIQWLGQEAMKYMPWVLTVAAIRVTSLLIALYKYHTLAFLHTSGNKLTGFMVFLSPLFLLFGIEPLLYATCVVAIISAVEECVIHLTSRALNTNITSILKLNP